MLNLDDPRGEARKIIQQSIAPELWEQNLNFTKNLEQGIRAHRLFTHPIIQAWEDDSFTIEAIQRVHLETRAGLIEPFMDSLLRMMQTTTQLESSLGSQAKVAARFLIQLNVIDELGFKPDSEHGEVFRGHPGLSHYLQLVQCMSTLGVPPETWADYPLFPETIACRATLEDNQNDHLRLAVVLAGIETVFMPYYGPWGKNTIAVCEAVNVPGGYHTIHLEEDDGSHIDDDHSEDSWYIVRQALTSDRYDEINSLAMETLDTWAGLMDVLLANNQQRRQSA